MFMVLLQSVKRVKLLNITVLFLSSARLAAESVVTPVISAVPETNKYICITVIA